MWHFSMGDGACTQVRLTRKQGMADLKLDGNLVKAFLLYYSKLNTLFRHAIINIGTKKVNISAVSILFFILCMWLLSGCIDHFVISHCSSGIINHVTV